MTKKIVLSFLFFCSFLGAKEIDLSKASISEKSAFLLKPENRSVSTGGKLDIIEAYSDGVGVFLVNGKQKTKKKY